MFYNSSVLADCFVVAFGPKLQNKSAKIFPRRAENQKAENTKAPKRSCSFSMGLFANRFWSILEDC